MGLQLGLGILLGAAGMAYIPGATNAAQNLKAKVKGGVTSTSDELEAKPTSKAELQGPATDVYSGGSNNEEGDTESASSGDSFSSSSSTKTASSDSAASEPSSPLPSASDTASEMTATKQTAGSPA